ncbi:MAG: DNA-binding protein WhiA [Clostridia bacterium]|nr:DNA-binding protein WhiA [Clostridia bacterium]
MGTQLVRYKIGGEVIGMSFTVDVKNELCQIKYDRQCCMRAHLCGLAGFCGAVVIENGEEVFKMRTENKAIAQRARELIELIFAITPEVSQSGKICSVVIRKNVKTVLKQLGFVRGEVVKFTADPFVLHDECCKTAFLAGAFLGGGYVRDPKDGYHFEVKTHYRTLSNDLLGIMEEIGFEAKPVVRKSEYVVYLKQSDAICDILATIGAPDAMFEMCNMKILKDVRNNITRKVNCDTANITKAADAAAIQLKAIHKIKSTKGLEALPKSLEQAARLRLENPEANLTELGQMLSPPISKSGINYRLRKIIKFAEEI